MKLHLEKLEDRNVPSVLTSLSGGTLLVNLDGPGTHTASFFNSAPGQYALVADGQTFLFATTDVNLLVINGAQHGTNVIQNATSVADVLTGGSGKDTLFGGAGSNLLDAGKGPDSIYSLLGTNTILAEHDGPDRVFTNFGAMVTAGPEDTVVRFFGPGRTPGTPFIGFDATLNDDVLYITPSNNGSSVVIDQGQGAGSVLVTYDLGDGSGPQTATFTDVSAISYFGGTGSDFYQNNTSVTEAVYGSAGNDTLVGGYGFSLKKGSGGNDLIIGRSRLHDDISGNGGADTLILTNSVKGDIIRTDAADFVYGADAGTIFISP